MLGLGGGLFIISIPGRGGGGGERYTCDSKSRELRLVFVADYGSAENNVYLTVHWTRVFTNDEGCTVAAG